MNVINQPVLTNWFLLIPVYVQATIFILSGSWQLRVYLNLSVSQSVSLQITPWFGIIRSQTVWKHLGNNSVKNQPEWYWMINIFATYLFTKPRCIGSGMPLSQFKNCFISIVLWESLMKASLAFRARWFGALCLWWQP